MWTAAIVMTHELAYDPSQMPLVEGDQEVEALAANRPDDPALGGSWVYGLV
jgi:hypothetical protein